MLSLIIFRVKWFFSVFTRATSKFYLDDCFSRASSLAYTTLFALVPLTWLFFNMFDVFGLRREQIRVFLANLTKQILPPSQNNSLLNNLQDQVVSNLEIFAKNIQILISSTDRFLSIIVLIVTSIALLNTIESALNALWRVTPKRTMTERIVNSWAIVSLGPILIIVSIYWTTKVSIFNHSTNNLPLGIIRDIGIPIFSSWIALSLLYYSLPEARVRLKDAGLGALIASLLFEMTKRVFTYYVGLSSTYSTVYGVLATFPLFLFWLYLTWVVILFGAQISYQSGMMHVLKGRRRFATDMGDIGFLFGLRVLYCISRDFLSGKPLPTEQELAIETGADPTFLRQSLDLLASAKLLTEAEPKTYTRSLLISPDKISFKEIYFYFLSKAEQKKIGTINDDCADYQHLFFNDLVKFCKDKEQILDSNIKELLGREIMSNDD